MISLFLAAAFTFTATATGVEKGAPLEFMFAGKDTDRDYETMFLLDAPIDQFLTDLEKAGIPRGVPTDYESCRLWPVGVPLRLEPSLSDFVETEMPEGIPLGSIIYTGGMRLPTGVSDASTNMPAAVFALYSLAQSPLVFNGIYEQGLVYGAHKTKVTLKKGERLRFKLVWDEKTKVKRIERTIDRMNMRETFELLKRSSQDSELDVCIRFSDDLTTKEATLIANALESIDSIRIKINGRDKDDLFYRAFLPLVKWRDRKERLTQPFEITLGDPDKIFFIEEDWSVEGDEPKLTERPISYEQMTEHIKTDTVFIFAQKNTTIRDLRKVLKQIPEFVVNHYVYWERN